MNFESAHGLNDLVSYTPSYELLGREFQLLQLAKIVGVKFTLGKVWYDIVDVGTDRLIENVDSCLLRTNDE